MGKSCNIGKNNLAEIMYNKKRLIQIEPVFLVKRFIYYSDGVSEVSFSTYQISFVEPLSVSSSKNDPLE